MAKTTAQDKTLGTLHWDPFDHTWGAAVPVDFFRGYGSSLREYEDVEESEEEETEVEDLEPAIAPEDDPFSMLDDLASGKTDIMSVLQQTDEFKEMMKELKPEEKNIFSQAMSNLRELGEDVRAKDPLVPEDLFKAGKFKLTISATEKKKPPAATMGRQWKKLADNDKLWQEIVDFATEKYRAQRPTRIKWWKAMYGESDSEMALALPEVTSSRDDQKIIRPQEFRLHTNGDVGIHFDSYWHRADGFGVRLRDGKIYAIGEKEVALTPPAEKPRAEINHPVLGELRYGAIEWAGYFRWEPMREYLNVVEDRVAFGRMNLPPEYPRSSPKWRFIEGDFILNIHAMDESEKPTAAHAKTFSDFLADPQRAAKQIIDAIFAYYKEHYRSWKKYFKGKEGKELLPEPTSPDVLRERLTFQSMLIYPPGEGSIALGFGFDCSWEQEHGLGVRWRDGKVEEVGYADVAFTE